MRGFLDPYDAEPQPQCGDDDRGGYDIPPAQWVVYVQFVIDHAAEGEDAQGIDPHEDGGSDQNGVPVVVCEPVRPRVYVYREYEFRRVVVQVL